MRKVAIINPVLDHQLTHGRALKKDGWEITADPRAKGDVVMISGPHYAYRAQIGHPRLLMIDRAWWNDPLEVSVSQARPDGSRVWPETRASKKGLPELGSWKTREEGACLFLDYGMDPDPEVVSQARARFSHLRIRRHPAQAEPTQPSLAATLSLSDVVIGYKTTALVEAAIRGVPVICLDTDNVVAPVAADSLDATLYRGARKAWLAQVASAQVSMTEIADGILSTLFGPLFRS